MKKLLHIFIIFTLIAVSLVGCSYTNQESENSKKTTIVCTVFPQYDFARAIGAENVDVSMLLNPGADVHGYEPSIADIQKINNADLFIYCSGESEGWALDIVKTMEDKSKAIDIAECVRLFEEETVEGMEVEHEEETSFDEHVWTSPSYAMTIVGYIADKLCQIDPENKTEYVTNADIYCEQLEALDEKFTDAVNSGSKNTLVFSDRFPFRYLVEEYSINYYAAFKGCSSASEPTLSTVSFLIDKVKQNDINVVLYTETSDQKTADVICEATGAKKALLHSCHNLTKQEFASGVTYLSLMSENADIIKEALK